MQDIKWGVLGCGNIAHKFAQSLNALDSGKIVAGASRTPGKAEAFSQEYEFDRVYSDYEALVQDSEVDAIYVATTHNFHFENVRLCLENDKHVLCEKPLTINAAQARELFDLSKAKNLFLMEAVWTRFLPAMRKLQEVLKEGAIGEVTTVHCDFGFSGDFDDSHRLKNLNLAGGALLDLGIYPINLAAIVFGMHPHNITSSAVMSDTGVDERSFYFFEYKENKRAILSSSFTEETPVDAKIYGTGGYIYIPPGFLGTSSFEIHRNGQEKPEIHEFPCPEMERFKYEIEEAMECISAGKTESEIMPHAETLAIMETMDTLRSQWGMKYPEEA